MLCEHAGVTKGGYYKWFRLRDTLRSTPYEDKIIELFYHYKGKKGARSLKMLLARKYKIVINLKKILRIMRKNGLITKVRRRNPYRNLLKSGDTHKVFPNLVQRDFVSYKVDTLYTTDITYLPYKDGQLAYLSVVKDLSTSEVIHFNVSRRINTDIATHGLDAILGSLPTSKVKDLIIHSDQGSTYTASLYRNILAKYGVKQSMSRRGNCLDNAPIESFFGHLKDEVNTKSCKSYEEVVIKIKDYINYYNNDRPQWVLKGKTPAECRGLLKDPFY